MTQRFRITFSKDGPLRWVAHLDMMRTWERTIRRATLPLAYTQGFSPHPRIAMAAPLPVGVSGTHELIDLWLDEALTPVEVAKRLSGALPPGLGIVSVEQVSDDLPSMQSTLLAAEYAVRFEAGAVDLDAVASAIEELLARESLDWEEQRGEKTRRYDMRATILGLTARTSEDGGAVIEMQLSLEEGRTGRPQQVLLALGVAAEPLEIVRESVELKEPARRS